MNKFNAVKSFFVESGTYQAPVLRTYETHYDDAIVKQYLNDTSNGTQIVPNAFNNIGSAILKPSAAPTGIIAIENGWVERRLTFVIEIEVADHFTNDSKSIVFTGYTDHTDISPISKQFDPNMRLYFNTSTIISTMVQRMGNGAIHRRRAMMDSSHLLNTTTMKSIQSNQGDPYNENTLWYATPRNVINEMNNINNTSSSHFSDQIMDFRSRSNPMDVHRSKRENAVPTMYLSKILRGVTDNLSSMSHGIAEDENLALMNASMSVSEEQNASDPVLMEILMNSDYLTRGFITWSQLCHMVPNLDSTTLFTTRASKVIQTNVPDAVAGNFNHWQGVSHETLIANNIAQLVPAMMTSCMIGTVSFAFTNDNITLTPTMSITSGLTMVEGVPFTQVSSQFETRFLSEIAPLITDQGRTLLSMIVQCSLGTETFVSISRNGEAEIPFCAPTFCDSLYTPILSPTEQGLTNIAADLQNIANSVNNAQFMATQPQTQMGYY